VHQGVAFPYNGISRLWFRTQLKGTEHRTLSTIQTGSKTSKKTIGDLGDQTIVTTPFTGGVGM